MSTVRVRFAPSPTGFFHIGSARTALFNWLYARHTGGTFVLRVEDTDKERNTEESLQCLKDGMKWLGLDWDEGPEKGGDFGPYFQSERDPIYQEALETLRAKDRVYEKEGATWFKISGDPQVIEDQVRGTVSRTEEKDFVIFRSDGSPVFHFVNVVDDIKMGITHVIRGEDHLSNTSKHTELFKAFDAPIPVFAHIPLILKQEGQGKMSKRDKGALLEDYEKEGFFPAAIRNYLCLLGWSPKDDREIIPFDEIIQLFDFKGINKDNARFDEKKMTFFNTEYLRMLPLDELVSKSKPILSEAGLINDSTDEAYLKNVLEICQEKLRSLPTLPEFVDYFFKEDFAFNEKAKTKIFKKGEPLERLKEVLNLLKNLSLFEKENIQKSITELAETNEQGIGSYFQILRFAISGTSGGPHIDALIETLGQEKTVKRIKTFLENQ